MSLELLLQAQPEAADLYPGPLDFAFDPHAGPVHGLDASPFHRNLFASASADGRIAVFSTLQVRRGG